MREENNVPHPLRISRLLIGSQETPTHWNSALKSVQIKIEIIADTFRNSQIDRCADESMIRSFVHLLSIFGCFYISIGISDPESKQSYGYEHNDQIDYTSANQNKLLRLSKTANDCSNMYVAFLH